ncbi:MAG TPA: hypothetical protein VGS08_00440 [Candidatus Saccharimonadales bacterium]|nr:hypothetical protein [Candidatus Saccharimonadales bacterium]
MATTVKQSFKEYLTNLELTDRQQTTVSNCRQNVTKALEKELVLHDERSKVIGSWDRHTLTRYLSEADVDVMVILHYGKNKAWDSSEGAQLVLDRFRQILQAKYPKTTMRSDTNCVTMALTEFRLDVVPAFKHENGYYRIPDTSRDKWVPTNPFTFADYMTNINTNMDNCFKPLIKMVKGWNREERWPIKSFHLECMMYHRYHEYTQAYTYSSMLALFFKDLPNYLRHWCYDPVMQDRLDDYLGTGDRGY